MKILKTLGIGLVVILLLLVIVSAFLPSKIHVERSIVINAPAQTVYNTVNTLGSWQNWSYWDQIDPEMQSTFEGPESGVGSIHHWTSDNDSVGTGSLEITESTPNSSIRIELTFETMKSQGAYIFDETENGVKTTMYMDMEMPFAGRILPGLLMDDWLGKDIYKTLEGLKSYTESLPPPTRSWPVETVTTTPADVMSISITCKESEIPDMMGMAYGRIQEVLQKQSLQMTGPAYAVYHVWSPPDTIVMEPGLVVDKMGKDEGDVKAGKMEPVKAVKIDFYGDYSGLGEAHGFINKWIQENNEVIIGSPWEVYLTDPSKEPDTSKWMTSIYYPVQ